MENTQISQQPATWLKCEESKSVVCVYGLKQRNLLPDYLGAIDLLSAFFLLLLFFLLKKKIESFYLFNAVCKRIC